MFKPTFWFNVWRNKLVGEVVNWNRRDLKILQKLGRQNSYGMKYLCMIWIKRQYEIGQLRFLPILFIFNWMILTAKADVVLVM